MRGCSYIFGGFPNEEDLIFSLYENMPIELTERFWYYIAMFIVGVIGGLYYQNMNDNEHEMLKSDKNYKKSDDNYQRVKEKVKKHKEELKVKVKKQTANIKVKAGQVKEKLLKKKRNEHAELKVTFMTKD